MHRSPQTFVPLSWELEMGNEREKAWGGTITPAGGHKRRDRPLSHRTFSGGQLPLWGPQGTGETHCLPEEEKGKHLHPRGRGRKHLLPVIPGGDWLP